MKAWLTRGSTAAASTGERIELPDGSGLMTFGRSPKCTLVFDEPKVSARHCEVAWDGGFWRVRDLGSEVGTTVNGLALTGSRALFSGDVIGFGGVWLTYQTDLPAEDPALIEAIAANPEAEEPWLVYGDQLQEHGDPLGERIARARAGGRLDHQPWLGPLWELFVTGGLELDWHLGFARRATIRSVAGRLSPDWRATAATLFNLRVGKFVREVVIDLPRLEPGSSAELPASIAEAQRWFATLPSTPESLGALSLGYHLAPRAGTPVFALELLEQRLPRLKGTTVYTRATSARLRTLTVHDGTRLVGIDGVKPLTHDVLRVRRGLKNHLHLEAPPGLPLLGEGNPCFFAMNEGRFTLVAGRMRGELRVNQRVDSHYELLPGDLIEVQAAAKFRFEVA
jgi:uncharacterized protein (TIGR02996 family)